MPVRVSVKDIVDALQMQTEDSLAFLDPDSGKVERLEGSYVGRGGWRR
jgi:hypothetical protein